jgi:hypothetical protein
VAGEHVPVADRHRGRRNARSDARARHGRLRHQAPRRGVPERAPLDDVAEAEGDRHRRLRDRRLRGRQERPRRRGRRDRRRSCRPGHDDRERHDRQGPRRHAREPRQLPRQDGRDRAQRDHGQRQAAPPALQADARRPFARHATEAARPAAALDARRLADAQLQGDGRREAARLHPRARRPLRRRLPARPKRRELLRRSALGRGARGCARQGPQDESDVTLTPVSPPAPRKTFRDTEPPRPAPRRNDRSTAQRIAEQMANAGAAAINQEAA